MLDYIRSKSSSKFASLVLIIMALAMGLWGVESFFISSAKSSDIAIVSGKKITKSDLYRSLQSYKIQYSYEDWQNLQSDSRKSILIRKNLLAKLIYKAGIEYGFEKYHYDASDLQVQSFIKKIPLFQVEDQFDIQRYNNFIQKLGFKESDFISDIKYSLILKQIQDTFKLGGFVLDGEKRSYQNSLNNSIKVKYLEINPKKINVNIDDKSLKNFYNSKKELFTVEPYWNIDYIYIPFELIKSRIKVKDSQIRKYYNLNKSKYIEPKKLKFKSFIISKNGNLSAQDVINKLPLIKPDNLKVLQGILEKNRWYIETNNQNTWSSIKSSPILNELANNLVKDDVSKFKKLDNNRYLAIQITDIKDQSQLSFDKVKLDIKNLLINKEYYEKISDLSDKLATLIYTNPDTLSIASKAFDVLVKNINLQDKSFFKESSKVQDYISRLNESQINNNSDIFNLDKGLLVINPRKLIPVQVKNFVDVKEDVKNLYQLELSNKLAKNLAEKIIADQNSSIIKKYNLKWNIIDKLNIYSNYDSLFLAKALSLSNNSIIYFKSNNGNLIVVKNLKPVEYKNTLINKKDLNHDISDLEFELVTKGLLIDSKLKLLINDNDLALIN